MFSFQGIAYFSNLWKNLLDMNFFNTFINALDENCITVHKVLQYGTQITANMKNNKGDSFIIQTD